MVFTIPVLKKMAKKKRKGAKKGADKNLRSIFKKIFEEKERVRGVEELAFEQVKKKSRK
jgi:acyl-[acyl carrier protein]--UDP-N-acetylglucosamine O-acyltransferase